MRLLLRHLIFAPLILALTMVAIPLRRASAEVFISVAIAPPELPVYEQPSIPGYGYIWTPGYWAYGPDGYYWIPGTWVLPPTIGFLWTPGYWGWSNGLYVWNAGYWGPHVGFYGGINYGFGYFGSGYDGGYWQGRDFYYNRTVNNFGSTRIVNVYERPVSAPGGNRVSFHGGTGGTNAQPTAEQQAAARERHLGPTALQTQHVQTAATNPQLRATVNHGKPPIAATSRPGQFGSAASPGAGGSKAGASAGTKAGTGPKTTNQPQGGSVPNAGAGPNAGAPHQAASPGPKPGRGNQQSGGGGNEKKQDN